jgi:hypothetical protein
VWGGGNNDKGWWWWIHGSVTSMSIGSENNDQRSSHPMLTGPSKRTHRTKWHGRIFNTTIMSIKNYLGVNNKLADCCQGARGILPSVASYCCSHCTALSSHTGNTCTLIIPSNVHFCTKFPCTILTAVKTLCVLAIKFRWSKSNKVKSKPLYSPQKINLGSRHWKKTKE